MRRASRCQLYMPKLCPEIEAHLGVAEGARARQAASSAMGTASHELAPSLTPALPMLAQGERARVCAFVFFFPFLFPVIAFGRCWIVCLYIYICIHTHTSVYLHVDIYIYIWKYLHVYLNPATVRARRL